MPHEETNKIAELRNGSITESKLYTSLIHYNVSPIDNNDACEKKCWISWKFGRSNGFLYQHRFNRLTNCFEISWLNSRLTCNKHK